MFGLAQAVDPSLWRDPRVHKALLIAGTWLVAFLLSYLNGRFFDRLDRSLTTYGIPERRLSKLDFLTDVFIMLIAAFVTLAILGVGQALWGAVAVTSVVGIMVGLAAQRVAQNLLAGIVILFERPFIVGDTVEVDGRIGEVSKVSLHTTSLVTPDGLKLMLPNQRVLDSSVTNYSARPDRRVTVQIDVEETRELDRVRAILREAVEGERHLVEERPIRIYATESLDEGVRFQVRYWVQREHYAEHCLPSATERILDALNEADLPTAMPAQKVRLQEP